MTGTFSRLIALHPGRPTNMMRACAHLIWIGSVAIEELLHPKEADEAAAHVVAARGV